jgi:hypothetical protein
VVMYDWRRNAVSIRFLIRLSKGRCWWREWVGRCAGLSKLGRCRLRTGW